MRVAVVNPFDPPPGDVMYDSALHYTRLARERSDVLDRLGLGRDGYYLATVHRASNTDDPAALARILQALGTAGREVVLPVHPRIRKPLAAHGLEAPGVCLIDPVSYLDMLLLEANARAILTDSGGVQKEAYFAGVPCVTLRDETEWVELVQAGWNRLAGTDPDRIAEAVAWAEAMDRTLPVAPLYGDGHAAEKILALLLARG